MRGQTTIEVHGQNIPLLFVTGTFNKFCKMNGGLSVSQFYQALAQVSIEHLISLLWCAAEKAAQVEKKPFNTTHDEVEMWIDAMGGIAGKNVNELLLFVGETITPSDEEAKETTEEKKISVGESSMQSLVNVA